MTEGGFSGSGAAIHDLAALCDEPVVQDRPGTFLVHLQTLVGRLALALARCQHRHRRLVSMHDGASQNVTLQRIYQRLQPNAAYAYPRQADAPH